MNVLLLDAYNLIYRAKSGFTKGSFPIAFNFFRGLRPLVEKFNPDKVYFVLEGNPSFRSELSSNSYKSNRTAQSRDFYEQKANIISLVKNCFPFEVIRHPNLECDDTIATYASIHYKKGDDVTVVSSDSDFTQLLNTFDSSRFRIYNPVKKSFVEKTKYDYVTWKALRGDPTDNIPGLPRVGDKTAENLCLTPSLLEEILKNPNNLRLFENNINLIRLVDFSNNLSEVEVHTGISNFEKLKEAFEKMEFTSVLKEQTWKKYCDTFKNL
jgi:DNA polymerase-1